jgi:hypothetical protein
MHQITNLLQNTEDLQVTQWLSPRIGRLSGHDAEGRVLVAFEGSAAKAARLLSGFSRADLSRPHMLGRDVLLVFENGDAERPIIVGLLADPLEEFISLESPVEKPTQATVDGKHVSIEATEEIVLKCGDGSITLKKDGKIVIKGTHLLSRSSGPNRIKGGRVDIN